MSDHDPFAHDAFERAMFGQPPFDPNPPPGSGGGGKGGKPQSPSSRAKQLAKAVALQEQGGDDAPESEKLEGDVDLSEIERKILRERDARRRGY